MIRQPPAAVPSAIAVAQETLTHVGTAKSPADIYPRFTMASVMTPMDFWASFAPCEKAMNPADIA